MARLHADAWLRLTGGSVFLMLFVAIFGLAQAGTWTKEVTWELKTPGPEMTPFDIDGAHRALVLDRCIPGASADANGEAILGNDGDPSCLASEADVSWASSNSNFYCKSSSYTDSSSDDWIVFEIVFDPPEASSGPEVAWPSSWPSYVDCAKTYGPYTHKWRVNLSTDTTTRTAVHLPSISTVTSWSSTVNVTIPSSWGGRGFLKWVRIPQDSYSGEIVAIADDDGVRMMTTSAGSTPVATTACAIMDQAAGFDWLIVGIRDGTTAGSGYCQATKNGSPVWMKVTWTY